MVLGKAFRVWKKSQPRSVLLECKHIEETLLFESGAIAVLTPEECEHVKKQYTKVIDAHACLGVLNVNLGSKHVKYLFLVTGCSSVGRLYGSEIQRITDVFTLFLEDSVDLDYVTEVRKLLCSGTFYFTSPVNATDSAVQTDFESDMVDLSLSAQCRYQGHSMDDRFVWNQNLHSLPKQYGVDTLRWLIRISCGSVEVRTVYAGSYKAKVTVMSRLSCSRAGTRFNVRGVDDYGEVANFVETEQAISYQGSLVSFVQLRGSIPLFWEQPGFQTGAHKVKMSRGFEACGPAFRRHVDGLRSRYGSQLFLSLLNIKEGEALLSTALQDQVKDYRLEKTDLDIVTFDYHHHCRGGSQEKLTSVLMKDVGKHLLRHGFFSYADGKVRSLQQGTIRTNCMDCLDRTNAVQTFLGLETLKEQIQVLGIDGKASMLSRFHEVLRDIWKINGDNISKIYAGTGAMDGKAKMGKLKDGAKSVARTVRNNFLDGTKQESIDILLTGNAFVGDLGGRARALLSREDALGPSVVKAHLCDRHQEFVEMAPLRVCVGTWNVNGGRQFRSIAYKNQSMHDWLLDARRLDPDAGTPPLRSFTGPLLRPRTKEEKVDYQRSMADDKLPFEMLAEKNAPHVFAIGFEEIVDLKAANIVSTSSLKKREWGSELQRVISRDQEYVLLTCEQLVGVCLYVFIQPRLLPHVRDVAIDSVKTGMHGKAGNKGGVAIRFLLYSTSFCFVCAHLAAGQAHALERAADYADISKRLSFPMGRTVESHDYVFWCGDFNYRIDLPIEEVKELIEKRDFPALQKYDQLRHQMKTAKAFQGFTEGITDFVPTYKYDLFSDDFDTSEKSRIPAWTDRVLWKHKTHPSYVEIIDNGAPEGDMVYIPGEEEVEEPLLVSSLGSSSNEPACPFNHGGLVYYGRAELRISDHRPVVAIVDVEVEKVQLSRRNETRTKVQEHLGPADPTIVVHPRTTDELLDVELLTTSAEEYGIVVLIRLVGDDAYITFHDSRAALRSLNMNGRQIGKTVVDVYLRSDESLASEPDESLLDTSVPSIPVTIMPAMASEASGSQSSSGSAGQDCNPKSLRLFSASLDSEFAATPLPSPTVSTGSDTPGDVFSMPVSEAGASVLPSCSRVDPTYVNICAATDGSSEFDQEVARSLEAATIRVPPPIPPTSRNISPMTPMSGSLSPAVPASEDTSPSPLYRSEQHSPLLACESGDSSPCPLSDRGESSPVRRKSSTSSPLPRPRSSPPSPITVDDAFSGRQSPFDTVGEDISLNGRDDDSIAYPPSFEYAAGGDTWSPSAGEADMEMHVEFEDVCLDVDESEAAGHYEQIGPAEEGLPTKSILNSLEMEEFLSQEGPPARPKRPATQPSVPNRPAQPARPSRPQRQVKQTATSQTARQEVKAVPPLRPGAPPGRPKAGPSRPEAGPARPEAGPTRPAVGPTRPETGPTRSDAHPARPGPPARPTAAPARPHAPSRPDLPTSQAGAPRRPNRPDAPRSK